MYQNYDSYNLLNEIRYDTLCKLYSRYKSAIKIALENASEKQIADAKVNEIDEILQEIEKYPISWSFYNSQEVHFSSEFENLIIFKEDREYLNID